MPDRDDQPRLACHDQACLDGDEARPLRIRTEHLEEAAHRPGPRGAPP